MLGFGFLVAVGPVLMVALMGTIAGWALRHGSRPCD
ncbi:MAG: hypothetical protein QOK40_1797 [Miltoncostaeaceae bacterium]|nr:hypothetical protein [Miltoncostaeaceae bacterium]